MLKFYSFDKPPDATLQQLLIVTTRTVAVYCVQVTRLLLLFTGFFFAFACLFSIFFHVSFLQPYAEDVALMYHSLCLSDHASHPFVVLPYQPAYVCPVLSAPSFFMCRTEGVPVLFAKPPQYYSCSVVREC